MRTYNKISHATLLKIVKIAGGKAELAKICGKNITRSHVHNWLYREKFLPADYVPRVYKYFNRFNGEITLHDIRPDIYDIDDDLTWNVVAKD